MSLYHIYRPSSLEQVSGNEKIVSSLATILENPEKNSRVFLFHGPTGCGKTTFGRIIKSMLNISDNDFSEINSSDFRGIDTIREIIKNCQYKPIESEYRMYLMDEVHQLSKDAQNALLKILEDTPKHVIFCLCTTDPQNLLAAIKNRCTQYAVTPLSEQQMKRLLMRVSKKEGTKLEDEIYSQIISDANGCPRAALNILEQVIASPEEDRLEVAKQTAVLYSESIELCRALLNEKTSWKAVATILEGLKTQNPESVRRHVMGYAQAVLLKADNMRAALVLESFMEPNFTNGFPQLILSCYTVIKN